MKRKICALVLALILVCSLACPAFAETNQDVRDGVAVVATVTKFQDGTIRMHGSGTGFFVNDEFLVTNHHVISDFIENGSGERMDVVTGDGTVIYDAAYAEIRVYFDSNRYVKASLVDYDEHKDIAILRLESASREREPLKLESPTEDMVVNSEQIRAVGYPGLAESWIIDATTSWDESSATITSGSVSRMLTQSGTGCRMLQIDCEIRQGNSGGPVVNESGNVVGISVSYVTNSGTNERVYYAINVDELILMLNRNSISYTMGDADSGSAAGDPTEPEENNMLPIILGVAAVLVIGGLVVVIVMMKKNKQPAPQPVPQPVGPVMKPVVRSYSQLNFGVSAQIGAQPILIGRGNSCTILFPANAPGISGTHCSVQYDPVSKDFIVTDLNSSYGTFLQSGQRMQPNRPYRMRAGDRFYLAEQSNTISLNLE